MVDRAKQQDSFCSFKVPSELDRKDAIGSLGGVQPRIKKAIQAITPLFEPIDPPGQSDWLWDHEEYGQPFDVYRQIDKRTYDKNGRNTIYIQPLEANLGINNALKDYCKVFFHGCQVKVREVLQIENVQTVARRINEYTNQLQLNARDILSYLETRVPKDAICVIAITKIDLYPSDEWNFIFGIGSLFKGVGVFSFARYIHTGGDMLQPVIQDENLVFYRAAKIMTHEISHMFGLKHCIYFKCLLNGSNHLAETDRTPLELCPICVRKLQSNIGFQFLDRYAALIEYCTDKPLFEDNDIEIFQKLYDSVLQAYGPHYAPK